MNPIEWLAKMTPGEALGWITGLSTLAIGIWTQVGKRGETVFTRIESERKIIIEERNRLTQKLTDSEKCTKECEDREEKLKQENEFLRAGHRSFIEFAEDILGGSYGADWIKDRAKQLLGRYKT